MVWLQNLHAFELKSYHDVKCYFHVTAIFTSCKKTSLLRSGRKIIGGNLDCAYQFSCKSVDRNCIFRFSKKITGKFHEGIDLWGVTTALFAVKIKGKDETLEAWNFILELFKLSYANLIKKLFGSSPTRSLYIGYLYGSQPKKCQNDTDFSKNWYR